MTRLLLTLFVLLSLTSAVRGQGFPRGVREMLEENTATIQVDGFEEFRASKGIVQTTFDCCGCVSDRRVGLFIQAKPEKTSRIRVWLVSNSRLSYPVVIDVTAGGEFGGWVFFSDPCWRQKKGELVITISSNKHDLQEEVLRLPVTVAF